MFKSTARCQIIQPEIYQNSATVSSDNLDASLLKYSESDSLPYMDMEMNISQGFQNWYSRPKIITENTLLILGIPYLLE